MKLVLIGDVGGVGGYHAGDEAMLDVAIEQLRRRGATDVVVISRDPADTASRYGVGSIATIGFPGRDHLVTDAVRDQWLERVTAPVGGATSDRGRMFDDGAASRARAIVDAIAAGDGVVVCGGGNLSSSWPEHLYERAAVLTIARQLGVPSVVTGQTIGPVLTAHHRAVLRDALRDTRLVGLREQASFDLAATLLGPTVPRRLQLDDAVFLAPAGVAAGASGRPSPHDTADDAGDDTGGFVALTVDPSGDGSGTVPWGDRVNGFASLARDLHLISGLPVRFVPHVFDLEDAATGDLAVGTELAERLGEPWFEVARPMAARDLAALTRRAAAVVSTRYHPIVFGLSASIPCIGIVQDHYTSVKLSGALAHAGLAGWTVPADAVAGGLATALFDELWSRRAAISKHLDSLVPAWRLASAAHWDDVALALSAPATTSAPAVDDREPVPVLDPDLPGLHEARAIALALMARTAEAERTWRESFGEAQRYARSLEETLSARATEIEGLRAAWSAARTEAAEIEDRLATTEAAMIGLRDDTDLAERSAAAARDLAAQARRRLDAVEAQRQDLTAALAEAEADAARHREHLAALHATRTMRWTAGPRRAWERLRQRRPRQRG